MAVLPTVYGPPLRGTVQTALNQYLDIGSTLLGLPPAGLAVDADEYFRHGSGASSPWHTLNAGSGNENGQFLSQPGGVFQASSGATANSFREHMTPGGITNTKTKLFYIACRFGLVTTIDAQARLYFGLRTADLATETLVVGAVGPVDSANLVLQYGGNFATSKVVLASADTSFHIYEFWNSDRNSYNVRIDGGAVQNVVPATGLTGGGGIALARGAGNGTTAANRAINIDWHVYIGERA